MNIRGAVSTYSVGPTFMVGRAIDSVGPTFMVGRNFFGRAMLALLQVDTWPTVKVGPTLVGSTESIGHT